MQYTGDRIVIVLVWLPFWATSNTWNVLLRQIFFYDIHKVAPHLWYIPKHMQMLLLYFAAVRVSFLIGSCDTFTHIRRSYFINTNCSRANVRDLKVFHHKLSINLNELISCMMKIEALCGILPKQKSSNFYQSSFCTRVMKMVSFHNFNHLRNSCVS